MSFQKYNEIKIEEQAEEKSGQFYQEIGAPIGVGTATRGSCCGYVV